MSGSVPTGAVIRALHRSLAEARDDQIAKIVAVVDSLPRRGEADALLAAVRPRLTKIKPPRPMNFGRLLHTPIERLVVPGPKWKRGTLFLPRTVLAPITSLVRAGLGADDIALVEATLARTDLDSESRLTEAGNRLWPAAAAVLAGTTPPADWQDASGLPPQDYVPIAAQIGSLLSEAAAFMALRGGDSATLEAVQPVLERLRAHGPVVFGMAICLLLTLLPMSSAVVIRAATFVSLGTEDRKIRQMVEHAIESAVDLVEERVQEQRRNGAGDAIELERTTRAIAQIEKAAARDRPERQRRLQDLRQTLDRICRQRIEQLVLKQEALLREALAGVDVEELILRLEEQMREIRRLEITGRALSPTGAYDALMRQAASTIRKALANWPGLALIDRVRLVELLLSPEDALELLTPG